MARNGLSPDLPAEAEKRIPAARTGVFFGAREGNRTPNLLFTRQVLCQLSYSGARRYRSLYWLNPLRISPLAPQTTTVQLDQDLLAERERAVLSVERSWWLTDRSKETAIRADLAMTPSTAYRLLHDVIDRDRALAYDPLVVLRLRRARRTRRRARNEGRTVSSPPN